MRGRLGWVRCFLFGRYGSAALVALRKRQHSLVFAGNLLPSVCASLQWFRKVLNNNQSRQVPFDLKDWPLVVSVSDGEGSGGVAVAVWMPRVHGFQPMVTRADVPACWLHKWTHDVGRSNAVMEIEAVGPLLACLLGPTCLLVVCGCILLTTNPLDSPSSNVHPKLQRRMT